MNATKMPKDQLIFVLRDGRQLGFGEYGDPNGQPIFFFHGLAGSRLDAIHLHSNSLLNNYRLISIDRPGMGLSSIDKKRTILSWSSDVEELADHLGIKKFSIIGHSGGAPFVAGCAYKIPTRLNGIAIVAGMGPFEIPEATSSLSRGQRLLNRAIKAMPWVATLMMQLTLMMFKRPGLLKYVLKQLPEVDQLSLRSLGSIEVLAAMMMESFRQGVTGPSQEMQLTVKPWGFDLSRIKLDCPVTVWQGGLDRQAPEMHAKIYAKLIPNANLTFFKHEGHLSILKNQGEEILRSVVCKY